MEKNIFQTNPALAARLIESIPGLIGVYNINTGEYSYVNDAVTKLLGYTKKEFTSGGVAFVSSLVHPDDMPLLMKLNQKALRKANSKSFSSAGNHPIVTFEYRIKHKDGSWRWLHTDGVVFDRNAAGKVEHVMNISIDITARREKELKAEAIQWHLAAIVSSSDDAIISKTFDGIITSWNKAASNIFGYTAKEAIGQHIFLLIPPDLRKEEETIIATLRKGQHIDHYETTRVTKSGKKIEVSLTISPIKDKDGVLIGASKIARDITQRKKYEKDIAASQERLQLAMEAGKIGIWDWDVENNSIVWSDEVYTIHGLKKGKKIGELEKYARQHHPEDAPRIRKAIKDALAGIKPYQEEFRIIQPDGSIRWVETKAHVIRDNKNKPIRMLGATTDITHRKMLEQQRTEFIGIASHELRTPVTSIKAFAQILEYRFKKEGHEASALLLKRMNSQLDKLTGLIGDLLDVTKIETGKLDFNEVYFDFNELINEIVEEIQPTALKHTIQTKLDTTKTVFGDRDRIGQVLTNFLTNAIKYSPRAEKVVVSTKHDEEWITVSVRDFGVGIPKKSQGKIFGRFFRIRDTAGQTFPGMGLGLFISSQIIKRQEGKIWVKSEKAKGSTFSFSLPLNRGLKIRG